MTALKTIQGDLVNLASQGKFDIIVHGCNCFNVMGGGIARVIRETWPEVYESDCKTKKGDIDKLGTFTYAPVNDDKLIVVNLYTQYGFHSEERPDVFEYAFFEIGLSEILNKFGPFHRFGFPLIGCGLAGGDEAIVKESLEDFADSVHSESRGKGSVTLVEFQS